MPNILQAYDPNVLFKGGHINPFSKFMAGRQEGLARRDARERRARRQELEGRENMLFQQAEDERLGLAGVNEFFSPDEYGSPEHMQASLQASPTLMKRMMDQMVDYKTKGGKSGTPGQVQTYKDPVTGEVHIGIVDKFTGKITPSTIKGKEAAAGFAPTFGQFGDFVVDKRTGSKVWEIPKTRVEKLRDQENQRQWSELALAERGQSLKEQPGWAKIDTAFAQEYNTLVPTGGLTDAIKNVDQMEEVSTALKSGRNLTGSLLSLLPDAVRTRTNPESVNVQQLLEEVVQRNLRVILGAQFTEKEGTRLIERAYNPALDEKTNAKRVDNLMMSMRGALEAKIEALDYFGEQGTLRGFKSKSLNSAIANMKGINQEIKKKKQRSLRKQPQKPVVSLPKVGDVRNGYKFLGGNPKDPKSWEKI